MFDLCHTWCIHLLYYMYPASQPTVPILHSSGPRIGPPSWSAYTPPVYGLFVTWLLNNKVRHKVSLATGATRLSIGLGQLRAGELKSCSQVNGSVALTKAGNVSAMRERLQQIASEHKRSTMERLAIEAAIEQQQQQHHTQTAIEQNSPGSVSTGSGIEMPPQASTYGSDSEVAAMAYALNKELALALQLRQVKLAIPLMQPEEEAP